MIDKATVSRILSAANIVEVVSDYVHLTRRGSNYMGLCPFHNERTPSFSVSPQRGICHCFSCGKGGSPVNFIMEKEGINYHDALLHLARKYGIKVEERELSAQEKAEQSRREAMMRAGDWAMRRFQENMLATPEGRDVGLQYFYQRGVTQQAIDKFKLGYALDHATDICTAAQAAGIDFQTLQETGLCGIGAQSGKPYDRFRGRVIFPILSPSGRPIAFGGRGIKGEAAKYINSPESPVYHKSDTLYGIFQAKNAIVRLKRCFLVEGYMDVIGMWQSGMENVVASSGTSLTQGQIALIHRFTDNVTLIYDGDAAGIHASLRGIDMLLSNKMNVKVLLLPDGDDPDSFARKHTPEEFQKYVDEHEEDFIGFKTRVLYADGTGSPQQRSAAVASIVTSIAAVPDLVQRSAYVQRTARTLGVAERILALEVGKECEKRAEAMRRERQQERLRAQYPDAPAQPDPATPEEPPVDTSIGEEVLSAASKNDKMLQSQTAVIEYVIKYGMLTFCSAEAEDGSEIPMSVAEYVQWELDSDQMHFSLPLYELTLKRVLSLREPYYDAYERRQAEVQTDAQKERDAFKEEIASTTGISFSSLQKKEKEFEERLEAKNRELLDDFACAYIGARLDSDPDDALRALVTSVITPRYELSRFHERGAHVPTDRERLPELLTRAITGWKYEILSRRIHEVTESLSRPGADVQALLAEISTLTETRRALNAAIGERVVNI